MRKLTTALLVAAGIMVVGSALADLSVKDGGGATRTIKNFVCETTKLCNATVLIKSDGTEIGTSSAEVFVGGRGTAGSAAGGVLTVQGSASGTAIPVSGTVTATPSGTQASSIASGQIASGAFSSGSVASGAFASGALASGSMAAGAMVDFLTTRQTVAAGTVAANSQLVGGIYNSTPITMTNGQGAAMQFDANGYLKVNTAAGAAAGGTSSSFGSGFPTPGTAAGFSDGTNMVAGRAGPVANSASAAGYLDALGVCQYLATPPTITDTRFNQVQCDVNGNTKVTVVNTNANGQAALASSSPVAIAKNSGTGSTVAGAAVGTAGTASAEVVTVQGIASMTPFLSNPGTAANWGIGATAAAVPANAMYNGFNSGGNLVGVAAATPLPVRPGDGTRNAIIDPCEANLQTYAPISITTATTTRIVAPSASNKTYICMLFLTSAAADNIGIVEGTGGTCGSGTAGVVGGTTAANGPNFAANGGMLLQAGGKVAAAQTAGTNVDLCLITSAATPLAGGIKYVQAP